jgi:GntR family transcriptional regulator
MVARRSSVPLYQQIEEDLRSIIDSGELPPESRVPSEAELSKRFGASRMTVRKALDRLAGDGLLFRQQGLGTFVSAPKISYRFSSQISFSGAMTAMGLQHRTRVLEAGMVRAPATVARALEVPAGTDVLLMRRLRIVQDRPAALHTAYFPSRLGALLESDLSGSLTSLLEGIGVRVDRARDVVDAVLATDEDARLLEVPAESPIIRVEGVAYAGMLDPVRYTEGRYPGGRFRFSVDTGKPANLKLEVRESVSMETAGAVD